MNMFLGEVRLFPYERTPDGWLTCDGRILYINEYPKLYMLAGTKFDGDGKQKFKLPDLQKKAPENFLYCMATDGEFPEVWSILLFYFYGLALAYEGFYIFRQAEKNG